MNVYRANGLFVRVLFASKLLRLFPRLSVEACRVEQDCSTFVHFVWIPGDKCMFCGQYLQYCQCVKTAQIVRAYFRIRDMGYSPCRAWWAATRFNW